jgi:hypothetical protein
LLGLLHGVHPRGCWKIIYYPVWATTRGSPYIQLRLWLDIRNAIFPSFPDIRKANLQAISRRLSGRGARNYVTTSGFGPFAKWQPQLTTSAVRGNPEDKCSDRLLSTLSPSGHRWLGPSAS